MAEPVSERLVDDRPNRARLIQSADIFADKTGLLYCTHYDTGLYIMEYDGR